MSSPRKPSPVVATDTGNTTMPSSTSPPTSPKDANFSTAPPFAPLKGHEKKASVASSTSTSYEVVPPTAASTRRASVPQDRVRLDLLLITGQRAFFDFSLENTTVTDVKEEVWRSWPQTWPTRPPSPASLRILHLGHILPDVAPLGSEVLAPAELSRIACKKSSQVNATAAAPRCLRLGTTTVMHLLIKKGAANESKGKSSCAKTEGSNFRKASAAAADRHDDGRDGGLGSCRCIIC